MERLFFRRFRTGNVERGEVGTSRVVLFRTSPEKSSRPKFVSHKDLVDDAAYIFAGAAAGICLFCGIGSLPSAAPVSAMN